MTSAEAIVVVLDVGPSVAREISPNGETFLQNSQLCATNIIQRKILSQSIDEIGLIIVGSEETNNPLADDEGYKNIEIAHSLRRANWSMVKSIAKYQKGTEATGDWLDALIVAADFIKTSTEVKKFKEKKIVMLTNFCSDVSDDEVDCIIQGLKNENVQVIAIGPQTAFSESQASIAHEYKSREQEEGEKLIARIVSEVPKSVICSFEDAIPQLMYFEVKKTRPTPWKSELTIGSSIKIPVKAFVKIAETKPFATHDIIIPELRNISSGHSIPVLPSTQNVTDDEQKPKIDLEDEEVSGSGKEFGLIDRDRIYQVSGNDAEAVDAADVIEGYMFGTTIVPVTDDDRPQLDYSSGEKCLSVLGFTKQHNVPFYLISGKGCHEVYPEDDEDSKRAFSALIQAMDSNDMIAIVRKVYRLNAVPKLTALFPMITPEYQCLVMLELPFSESVLTLVLPPLVTEKNKPTDEQLKAVDELMSKMNLMDHDEEDSENGAYDPHKTLDPYMQHYQSIVAKKALKGDSFISRSETDQAVKQLLSPKEELVEAALPTLAKIKTLFPLTKVTPKEGARKAAVDLFQQYAPDLSTQTVKQPLDVKDIKHDIGTVQPEEDFKTLINQGLPLDKACDLLMKVVRDLILQAFDADDFLKPGKCLLEMRKVCIEKNHLIYNNSITKLRKDLPLEKSDFWELVVRSQAGLITSSETDQSTVTTEEAKEFLEMITVKDEILQPKTTDEFDDLIDEM